MDPGVITVAVPVRDGAVWLEAVLGAVRRQRVDREVELLVCDSGSTDGSVDICRRHGARVIEIPPHEFSHGGTRNLLAREARGAHVAFLTQDAEPADDQWLARISGTGAALACGPYLPRPDASPMVRRELREWFALLGGQPRTFTAADLPDPPMPGPATFASSANLCVSRAVWEEVPFRPVAYAEDQQLVLDVLRAGHAKAWVPDAAVVHSHDYPFGTRARRWFDEFRALHDVYGWTAPANPRVVAGTVRAGVRADRAEGAGTLQALGYHLERAIGAAAGTRADRLPPAVRRRLSLERRAA